MSDPIVEVAPKLEAKAASVVKESRLPGAAVGVIHGDALPDGRVESLYLAPAPTSAWIRSSSAFGWGGTAAVGGPWVG